MRKILLILFLLSISLCTACDPPMDEGLWYIKNSTDQTLTLAFPPSQFQMLKDRVVTPGDSVKMYHLATAHKRKTELSFDLWSQELISLVRNMSLSAFSENNVLLKQWDYADRSQPDKQLFKESSWQYYKGPGDDGEGSIKITWVFEILPEDIE